MLVIGIILLIGAFIDIATFAQAENLLRREIFIAFEVVVGLTFIILTSVNRNKEG